MAIFGNINPVTGQTQIADPLARTLIAQSQNQEPIVHPLQLAGRLAQLGVGTYREDRQNEGQAQAFSDVWKQSGGDLTKFAELARGNRYLRSMGPQLQMKVAESQFKTAQDVEAERRKSKLRVEEKLDPRVQDCELRKAAASRPSVSVKVDTGLASGDVESVSEALKDARSKAAQIRELDAAKTALMKIPTGGGAETRLTLGQWSQSLGIRLPGSLDPKQTASAEEFKGILGDQILAKLKAMRPATDQDREFVERIAPGLSKTPEGNLKIIEYLQGKYRSDIKDALEMRQALEQRKSLGPYYQKRYGPDTEAPKEQPKPGPIEVPGLGQGERAVRLSTGRIVIVGPDGQPLREYKP